MPSRLKSLIGAFRRAGRGDEYRSEVGSNAPSDKLPENYIEIALGCSTVDGCIGYIADIISPLQVECDNPKIQALLDRPNSFTTREDLIGGIVKLMLAYGNAYLLKEKSMFGDDIAGLFLMDSRNVITGYEANGGMRKISYTFVDTEGINEVHTSDDIIHFRDRGESHTTAPSRIKRSWSRIKALMALDKGVNDAVENNPVIGLLLTNAHARDRPVDPDKAKELTKEISQHFAGKGAKRGSVFYLGGLTATEMRGPEPANAQTQLLRQDLIREISAVWKLPPFLSGATGVDKYNNITAQDVALKRDVFLPLVRKLEARLSLGLGCEVRFNTSELLSGDLMNQYKIATLAAGRPILTGNEARMLVNEPTIEQEDMDEVAGSGSATMADDMPADGDRIGEMPSDDGDMDNDLPS